jgi:hypothetical protein
MVRAPIRSEPLEYGRVTDRPSYKTHPLWNQAMALTRESYALAGLVEDQEPDLARRLKKAAVSVPARVASALGGGCTERLEHMLSARGALAELAREARRAAVPGNEELARRADELDRRVLFEFGAGEAYS